MICKKCGTQNNDNVRFCKHCGNSLIDTVPKKKDKLSKTIILLIVLVSIALIVAIGYYLIVTNVIDLNLGKKDRETSESELEFNSEESTSYEESIDSLTNLVSMPACENLKYTSAKTQLEEIGLAVTTEYEFSDDVSKDYIISQSIQKDTEIEVGSEVVLTISKGSDKSPYDYEQKLTVTASKGSSYADAVLYEWKDGDWSEIATYSATVGKNGIGAAREGSSTTPQGLHELGVVLSSNKVSTNLRVYNATSNTCVVDDTNSPYYNQIMEKGSVPAGTSYDNIGKGLTNGSTYATIYIEHNGTGFSSENVVSGNGSAIGLRGQYGKLSPTYGDVDISASDMIDLLSKLDISKKPMIEILTK